MIVDEPTPTCKPEKRKLSTSTKPALVICSPVPPVCLISAVVFVMDTSSLSVVTPVTSSVLDTFAVVSCVAPVTPSVPVIVVSPSFVTTNLGAPAAVSYTHLTLPTILRV